MAMDTLPVGDNGELLLTPGTHANKAQAACAAYLNRTLPTALLHWTYNEPGDGGDGVLEATWGFSRGLRAVAFVQQDGSELAEVWGARGCMYLYEYDDSACWDAMVRDILAYDATARARVRAAADELVRYHPDLEEVMGRGAISPDTALALIRPLLPYALLHDDPPAVPPQ